MVVTVTGPVVVPAGTTTEKLDTPDTVEIQVAETAFEPLNFTVALFVLSFNEKVRTSPMSPALSERLVIGLIMTTEFLNVVVPTAFALFTFTKNKPGKKVMTKETTNDLTKMWFLRNLFCGNISPELDFVY